MTSGGQDSDKLHQAEIAVAVPQNVHDVSCSAVTCEYASANVASQKASIPCRDGELFGQVGTLCGYTR